jgi:predicted GH43/DUF377 family glycosyl hydrolase
MAWKKLGLVFCPDKNFDWMQSHAANPVAEHLEDDIYRIYFSTRNVNNISSIGYVDIDLKEPNRILNLSNAPVLSPGELGTFDNDGVSLACIVQHGKSSYLYYLGWNLCKSVPWNNSIGLAIKSDLGPFKKYSTGPILGRDMVDPLTISYPWVLHDNGKWKMWYGSHLRWNDPSVQENFLHVIKYAESEDGINWKKNDKIVIPFDENKGEYAFAKPCVIKEEGIYKMWYAYRGNKYRIGYAESKNGVDWVRNDFQAQVEPTGEGWDSETVEYPYLFQHKAKKYILYNGNGYGKTGFGIAVWQA